MSEADKNKPKVLSTYELYVMRHGIAVARGTPGISDDAKRALTPEGKKKMEEVAQGLLNLGVNFDWIVTSPLVRAIETARVVRQVAGSEIPLDVCDDLRPGGAPEALIAYLAKHENRKRILVVGHEPDLSELAGRLIGAGHRAHLTLKKGGCCLVEFSEFPPKSPGKLIWWLTPRVMRRLK
ncbi:MAG: phosphohistidine phosphatase SixA [Deltaproteobacteria bacterium]